MLYNSKKNNIFLIFLTTLITLIAFTKPTSAGIEDFFGSILVERQEDLNDSGTDDETDDSSELGSGNNSLKENDVWTDTETGDTPEDSWYPIREQVDNVNKELVNTSFWIDNETVVTVERFFDGANQNLRNDFRIDNETVFTLKNFSYQINSVNETVEENNTGTDNQIIIDEDNEEEVSDVNVRFEESSPLTENEYDDIDKLVEETLSNVNIAFEKNNLWLTVLRAKDPEAISGLNQITLNYEIKDIVEFIKKTRDELRDNYKSLIEITNITIDDIKIKQFELMTRFGHDILPLEETFLVDDILDPWKNKKMFCEYNETCGIFRLSPMYAYDLFKKAKNPTEIKFYYEQFIEKTGRNRMEKYEEFLNLFNKAADMHGFSNCNEMLKSPYSINHLDDVLKSIMDEIKPLHQQLHAYIRFQLQKQFNTENETLITDNGPIPDYLYQHLVSNSHSDETKLSGWTIAEEEKPKCKSKHPKNLIDEIHEEIETRYKGLGFDTSILRMDWLLSENNYEFQFPGKFDDSLGKKGLKMYYRYDFDKHVLDIFSEYFKFIEYSYGYKQPWVLRKLQPRAFSSALGNGLRHSFENVKIGESGDVPKEYINKAIQTLSKIQSKYVISQTMRCLQTRTSSEDDCKFYNLKKDWQGITELEKSKDGDALAWKHNAWTEDDYEDIVSLILGFQIYEGLCEKTNFEGKHFADCSFAGLSQISDLIKPIIEQGATVSWKEQLKTLLPAEQADNVETLLTGKSLLRYFEPLQKWLENYNKENNIPVGWV